MLQVPEDEDGAFVGVQPCEGPGEEVAVGHPVGQRRRRVPTVERLVELDLIDPPSPTQLRATGVDEDLAEPAVEAVEVTQSRELTPRRDECVLGRVPRVRNRCR